MKLTRIAPWRSLALRLVLAWPALVLAQSGTAALEWRGPDGAVMQAAEPNQLYLYSGLSTERFDRAYLMRGVADVAQVVITPSATGLQPSYLVLKRDGTVMAWTYWKQVFNPDGTTEGVPVGMNFTGAGDAVPPGLTSVRAIAGNASTWMALRADGTVVTWPARSSGPVALKARSGLTGVIAIAAGSSHYLALKSDGTVISWFDKTYPPRTPVPEGLRNVKGIAATETLSAAVRQDGSIIVWGDKAGSGRPTPAGLGRVRSISGYRGSFGVVREDGSLIWWTAEKANYIGGNGTTGRDGWQSLSMSASNAMIGLTNDGRVAFAFDSSLPNSQTLHSQLTDVVGVVGSPYQNQAVIRQSLPVVQFESTNLGQTTAKTLTLTNNTASDQTVTSVEWGSSHAEDFSLGQALPLTVPAGQSRELTLQFAPRSEAGNLCFARFSVGDGSQMLIKLIAPATSPVITVEQPTGVRLESGPTTVVSWESDGRLHPTPRGVRNIKQLYSDKNTAIGLQQNGEAVVWAIEPNNPYSTNVVTALISTELRGLKQLTLPSASGGYPAYGIGLGGELRYFWPYATAELTKFYSQLPPLKTISLDQYGRSAAAVSEDGKLLTWSVGASDPLVTTRATDVVDVRQSENGTYWLTNDGHVVSGLPDGRIPGWSDIAAISVGDYSTALGLRKDGTLAHLLNGMHPPDDLMDVVSIAQQNMVQCWAARGDGTAIGWIYYGRYLPAPSEIYGITTVSKGGATINGWPVISAIREGVGFGYVDLRKSADRVFTLKNEGDGMMAPIRYEITGPAAADFTLLEGAPTSLSPNSTSTYTVRFHPSATGKRSASLRVFSNVADPAENPFTVPLWGLGLGLGEPGITARPAAEKSALTFGPLALDSTTGMITQVVSYHNDTGAILPYGIKLTLSKLQPGVSVVSSSSGAVAGSLEVLYSKRVFADETITLTLAYTDPKRRIAAKYQPTLVATALTEPAPRSDQWVGSQAKIRSVRVSQAGPLVEFDSVRGGLYVVHYRDADQIWHAAVHVLRAGGNRTMWIDRGQPETASKPVGTPQTNEGRTYQVSRIQ